MRHGVVEKNPPVFCSMVKNLNEMSDLVEGELLRWRE